MKQLLIIYFSLISIVAAIADIPTFDIITFEADGKEYFVQLESKGKLKNNDLCLYDYDWNYVKDFSEIINNETLKTARLFAFRSLSVIEMKHLNNTDTNQPDRFYNFTDPIDFTKITIQNPIVITSVIRGNVYGRICTKELKTEDNSWLESYDMIKIFSADDGELCEMDFYAIKGNLDPTDISKLKAEFKALKKNRGSFDEFFSRLYKEFIIMIGMCSC